MNGSYREADFGYVTNLVRAWGTILSCPIYDMAWVLFIIIENRLITARSADVIVSILLFGFSSKSNRGFKKMFIIVVALRICTRI